MIKKVFYCQNCNGKTLEEILSHSKIMEDHLTALFDNEVEILNQFYDPFIWKMLRIMSLISEADLIVFNNDWKESRECQIVMMTCEEYNMPFMIIPKLW